MLFNSVEFLFLFLPVTLVGWYALGRWGGLRVALAWLTAASLAFYGVWNPSYLGLLLASIAGNFLMAMAIARWPHRALLLTGVLANLGLLVYYKYANFFLSGVNWAAGTGFVATIALPLGVSFFTLTQIAYLVDVFRSGRSHAGPLSYTLFVSFFPHLIAGPLLHHRDMMTQFGDPRVLRFQPRLFAAGLTVFTLGLFKKVVLADGLSRYSLPVFSAAAEGARLAPLEAWGGATAFALQIYFDFSAYSEMALGLALMLNMRLPVNFFSPLKARSFSETWSRWHMSLFRFLKDYYFLPRALRDMHRPAWHRQRHMVSTLMLGAIWHGANWTFAVWGALHGLMLLLERTLGSVGRRLAVPEGPALWGRRFAIAGFFIVTGVFFRAADVEAATRVLRGMAGMDGWQLPVRPDAEALLPTPIGDRVFALMPSLPTEAPLGMVAVLAGLYAVCLLAPNVIEMTWRYRVALGLEQVRPFMTDPGRWRWRPSTSWGILIGALLAFAITQLSRVSEFLYFQF